MNRLPLVTTTTTFVAVDVTDKIEAKQGFSSDTLLQFFYCDLPPALGRRADFCERQKDSIQSVARLLNGISSTPI
jgi:hypothetical protein